MPRENSRDFRLSGEAYGAKGDKKRADVDLAKAKQLSDLQLPSLDAKKNFSER
jgi:hypothetical protein